MNSPEGRKTGGSEAFLHSSFLYTRRARRSGSPWLAGVGLAALAAVILLMPGCATEQRRVAPLAWYNVRPGMQREQVHELLGAPTEEGLNGAEDIYLNAIANTHSELHVQYDAGGTVAAKRYHYIQ